MEVIWINKIAYVVVHSVEDNIPGSIITPIK